MDFKQDTKCDMPTDMFKHILSFCSYETAPKYLNNELYGFIKTNLRCEHYHDSENFTDRTIRLCDKIRVTNRFDYYRLFNQLEHVTHLELDVLGRISDLPPNLTHLKFGNFYNDFINIFPETLVCLEFGDLFNEQIDNLPDSLMELKLGDRFNQAINHLPPNLIKLHLGHSFNQPINHLPPNLVELHLDHSFNQPIDSLPDSITKLTIGVCFIHSLDKLPKNLTQLNIYRTDVDMTTKLWRYQRI